MMKLNLSLFGETAQLDLLFIRTGVQYSQHLDNCNTMRTPVPPLSWANTGGKYG